MVKGYSVAHPNFKDRKAGLKWLRTQPRKVCIVIAARAALRDLPQVLLRLKKIDFRSRYSIILPWFRAASVAWYAAGVLSLEKDVALRIAAADAAIPAARAGGADGAAARAAAAANAVGARDSEDAMEAAAYAARADFASTSDAAAIVGGKAPESLARSLLWPDGSSEWVQTAWDALKSHLLAADEGWEVWTDWYEARLRGDPFDPDLERARVLIDDAIWKQGPKAVNAEIARLIAARAAQEPQGERLEINPLTGRIGVIPPEVQDVAALSNACDKVSDALDDFRGSAVANRAYALNPVLRTLDRALSRYSDNARRLHDDFADAARAIAQEIEKDADLDERPVTALRDACALGAIDIRIGVREVSDFEAARRRRIARQPSLRSQTAARRLLGEIGEGLEPDLRDDMLEDVATVEASQTRDTDIMPDSSARDAMLRSANRFAWLYRFAHLHPDRIAALAAKASRAYDDVERLVTLISGAKEWWAVIEWIMRSL